MIFGVPVVPDENTAKARPEIRTEVEAGVLRFQTLKSIPKFAMFKLECRDE